ncbi:MAG: hypothetical protein M0R03_07465 [Novosphingobium sp.]|nr:hypothetical protein [Novosphingobium sp.]
MTETLSLSDGDSIENVLRRELSGGDAALGTVVPVLRHLLASGDSTFFSDEIIARVRGILHGFAIQLLDAQEGGEGKEHPVEAVSALVESLAGNPGILGHVHALALEWHLTARMQARLGVDPVLTSLVQDLIASPEPEQSAGAMTLLASQARFAQAMRRMELPLRELPGDHFHGALLAMRAQAGDDPEADGRAAQAQAKLRGTYDEATSRLGLLSLLVGAMGGRAHAALSVSHAGLPLFLTALALGAGQGRDLVTLATADSRLARLALSLRAAGLKPAAIAEQCLALHPAAVPPEGFDALEADQAARILAMAGAGGTV